MNAFPNMCSIEFSEISVKIRCLLRLCESERLNMVDGRKQDTLYGVHESEKYLSNPMKDSIF